MVLPSGDGSYGRWEIREMGATGWFYHLAMVATEIGDTGDGDMTGVDDWWGLR